MTGSEQGREEEGAEGKSEIRNRGEKMEGEERRYDMKEGVNGDLSGGEMKRDDDGIVENTNDETVMSVRISWTITDIILFSLLPKPG